MTDDELTEAIARALSYDCEGTGVDVPDPDYDLWCVTHDSGIPSGEWCHDIAYAADRILPIVRAQQAEALRDAATDMGDWGDELIVVAGDAFDEDTWTEVAAGEWLRARADRIEKGAER